MKFSKQQSAVIAYDNSCTVLGAPGTGKTSVMFRKIAYLVEQGVSANSIAVLTFSYRSLMVMRQQLAARLGSASAGIVVGTTVDLPLMAMGATDKDNLPKVADNNFVRRLLRQSMEEVGFKGYVKEAEHIMCSFKSRGRKPSETEDHFDLFNTYKQRLEQAGLCDRYDLVRRHIIGMRNDIYETVRVKHIFIDNFQDVTQIQLLWLVDHLKAGTKIYAFGCDDLMLFKRAGALGKDAFIDFEEMNDLKRFTLTDNYRLPSLLVDSSDKLISPLEDRLVLPNKAVSQGGRFSIVSCQGVEQEMREIAKLVSNWAKDSSNSIGIITRHDIQARQVERVLNNIGIAHSSFARSIWETPGATLVLDLLEVVLSRASNNRLRNVLSVFGLSSQVIDTLFSHGLMADGWLKRGAPIPSGVEADLPLAALKELGVLRQKLVNYSKMMPEMGPKVVFKAMIYHMFEKLRQDDRQDALLALDELLSTKGSLVQILKKLTQHRKPDPTAKVIVSPVRESRNMAFTHVIVPFTSKHNYPFSYRVLPQLGNAERRLLYMAVTRASKESILLYSGQQSSYLDVFKTKAASSAA